MTRALITIEPVEPDLSPERIDERLAAGFFPFGQRWMTCHAWPRLDDSRDTIWVRVRLASQPPLPRWRRLLREGARVELCAPQVRDPEHQRLYDRFRELRHPDWVEEVGGLLHADDHSGLLDHTRELAVRDAAGRLLFFRWFVQGRDAIAGLSAVYDPSRSGHGTLARALADEWAAQQGIRWSYPGYVFPGARESWSYKLKQGRTEWLDPETRVWRNWDHDPPRPESLLLREMRRRLEPLGEVVHYPGWAVSFLEPSSLSLAWPYFVVRASDGDLMTLVIWNHHSGRYEELHVSVRRNTPDDGDGPPGPADPGDAG